MTAFAATATITASSSMSASAGTQAKFKTVPSTAGFAGITLDPTPYVYAAAQVILTAVQDASSSPNMARAVLMMSTLPYVQIVGVTGSALATRTGSTNTLLSTQTMIAAITGGPTTTFSTALWGAVANYLFNNPDLLIQDGFSSAGSVRSEGRQVLDIILAI